MIERSDTRRGYTAIELMLVLSIVGMLSAMTAPSVVSSMRSAAVNGGAEAIESVAREARLLAMSGNAASDYYGVVVYCAEEDPTLRPRCYAALTYGPTATANDIMTIDGTPGGEPVLQIALNRNVLVYTGSDHDDLTEDVAMQPGDAFGWLHQYRTGHVVQLNDPTARGISVGTPSSPVETEVTVRTLDGHYATRFAAYPVGLTGVEELER